MCTCLVHSHDMITSDHDHLRALYIYRERERGRKSVCAHVLYTLMITSEPSAVVIIATSAIVSCSCLSPRLYFLHPLRLARHRVAKPCQLIGNSALFVAALTPIMAALLLAVVTVGTIGIDNGIITSSSD